MRRFFQNLTALAALCGLFSQGAFAQMPGTFQPLVAVAAGGGVLDCIGGTVTYSGTTTIHTFTGIGSNDFACPTTRTINYLVVAGGGGGGGASYSGGGGAGGMLTGNAIINAGTSTVIVGASGTGGASGIRGTNGGNSIITTPGGAGSWFTILPALTPVKAGSGYTGYEVRERYLQGGYVNAPTNGTQIRVTIGQGAAGYGFSQMFCGHAGPASPSLNFDGSQVPILFAGAAAQNPVPATNTVSDAVNYSFSNSKDLICTWNMATSGTFLAAGNTNLFGNSNPGTGSNAGNTTWAGPAATSNLWGPTVQIEVFSNATIVASATGGGGGGQYATTVNGINGGSGGGGAYGATAAATGVAGQGSNGGFVASQACGSGGGGAGAIGVACASNNGGAGGAGLASSITGASVFYAGGGAGAPYTGSGATGGTGGGGNSPTYNTGACTGGANNTGGGGGGTSNQATGCDGGSGVVIISYSSGLPNVNCIGGTITTVGANTVHTFTASGNISCVTAKSINYLVVAGGGSGGGHGGSGGSGPGGGGAGGLLQGTGSYLASGASAITVGAGGAAPVYSSCVSGNGGAPSVGGNSAIAGIATASGGGGGACSGASPGGNGGSGGGAANTGAKGTGTSGQGNNGGAGFASAGLGGGGGGGCGAVGVDGTGTLGGNGGTGCTSTISGTSVCYAGGGAGAADTGTSGTATCGGGNAGATGGGTNPGTPGATNTGGGGGGSRANAAINGSGGGSGVVIISYATGSTQPPPPCASNAINGTFANVMGLWHFDNSGTDQSSGAHTLTLGGTAAYTSAQSVFGGYSTFIGSGGWASIGGAIYNGINDFTIEFWYYEPVAPNYRYFVADGMSGQGTNTFNFAYNANSTQKMELFTASGVNSGVAPTTGTFSFPVNSWHHYAYVRSGATFTFYYDGVTQPTTSTAGNPVGDGTHRWAIGSYMQASSGYPHGYFDEMRFSNVARYTASFTPQITAFCNN